MDRVLYQFVLHRSALFTGRALEQDHHNTSYLYLLIFAACEYRVLQKRRVVIKPIEDWMI